MGKNKQKKFAELGTYPNVFQIFDQLNPVMLDREKKEVDLKGKWRSDYFGNDHPLILELACGKGDYTVSLAEKYPHKNFIGIDIKGARIWTGAKKALETGLGNAAFVRMRIENIQHVFDKNEIDEIWITFPDPFPNKESRRLTAQNFLKRYKYVLRSDGLIHLKTDSQLLYEFTNEVIEEEEHIPVENVKDIYALPEISEILQIRTYYEKQHLAAGKTIKYVSFKFQ